MSSLLRIRGGVTPTQPSLVEGEDFRNGRPRALREGP
jgi:hypothetical protein